jgi:hypothetical protein
MATGPKNDDEADRLEAQLAAYRTKTARERYTVLAERLEPLRAMVESPAFAEVVGQAEKVVGDFRDLDSIDVHLRNMPGFMTRLRDAVNAALVPPVGVETPEAGGDGAAA